jgi:hypothetical protein
VLHGAALTRACAQHGAARCRLLPLQSICPGGRLGIIPVNSKVHFRLKFPSFQENDMLKVVRGIIRTLMRMYCIYRQTMNVNLSLGALDIQGMNLSQGTLHEEVVVFILGIKWSRKSLIPQGPATLGECGCLGHVRLALCLDGACIAYYSDSSWTILRQYLGSAWVRHGFDQNNVGGNV